MHKICAICTTGGSLKVSDQIGEFKHYSRSESWKMYMSESHAMWENKTVKCSSPSWSGDLQRDAESGPGCARRPPAQERSQGLHDRWRHTSPSLGFYCLHQRERILLKLFAKLTSIQRFGWEEPTPLSVGGFSLGKDIAPAPLSGFVVPAKCLLLLSLLRRMAPASWRPWAATSSF